MFLTGISLSINSRQTAMPQGIKQSGNDFQGVAQSLNSGDLTGAQKAFATLQKDLQSVQNAQQSTQPTNSTNPLSADIQGLAQSLNSGDISGAQKALYTLEQDLQNASVGQVGHHHHHHHHAVGASQAAATYSNSSNTTGSTSLQAGGSNLNVSA